MTTYLLDTNLCIRHLNQRSEAITQRLSSLNETAIAVCSVVKADLYYGAMKSRNPQQTLFKQRVFLERFISCHLMTRLLFTTADSALDWTLRERPLGQTIS